MLIPLTLAVYMNVTLPPAEIDFKDYRSEVHYTLRYQKFDWRREYEKSMVDFYWLNGPIRKNKIDDYMHGIHDLNYNDMFVSRSTRYA